MKLLLLCLLAACCSPLARTATQGTLEERKLKEILMQLNDVKEILQHSEQMVNTPPQNTEDGCCLSALRCFRANLQVNFNVTERNQGKLYKSLKHPITERGLDFCRSGNGESTCKTCESHPKATAKEFFNRLESLIQKAITRLSMN
ncbi:interleukin-21-like [Aulostomus maculatus]